MLTEPETVAPFSGDVMDTVGMLTDATVTDFVETAALPARS